MASRHDNMMEVSWRCQRLNYHEQSSSVPSLHNNKKLNSLQVLRSITLTVILFLPTVFSATCNSIVMASASPAVTSTNLAASFPTPSLFVSAASFLLPPPHAAFRPQPENNVGNLAFVQPFPWKKHELSPSLLRLRQTLSQEIPVPARTQSLRETLLLDAKSQPQPRVNNPRVVGHRGALYDHLENTREAFTRCVELGCDAVELDVFTLADGTVIVFHGGGGDINPGDLTDYCLNQAGLSILDLSFEQTQQVKFNPNYAEFPCPPSEIINARIPKLEEVLKDLKGTGVEIKIELKGENTVEPVLKLVEHFDMMDQISYSSFHHERLQQLRELRPDKKLYPSAALFASDVPLDFVQVAADCGATAVHLMYDTCTPARINAIRDAGMGSMAWFRGPIGMASDTADKYLDVGNEDATCYQAVIDTGVDELCVNRPDVLLGIRLPKQAAVQ